MIALYVESDGWRWTKDRLAEKIMDLQSIMNLEGKSPEEIVLDIKARKLTIDILMTTLKQVEGRAEQHRSNQTLAERIDEDIIVTVKD